MKKLTILVCDDEIGLRESLKLILKDHYELQFATNGEEAIEQSNEQNPDALILDIKMPLVNGLEALRRIRKACPKLPILMITGYEASEIAQQAFRLGASEYLVKPFRRHQVLGKLENILKGLPPEPVPDS